MPAMQAVWLENHALNLRRDIPLPVPPAGEALVRVRLAGICATDLELVKGYYPYQGVLGHEFVGEVVEASGAPELVGQRVVGEINAACGACPACLAGRRTHCEQRSVLGIVNRHGAFAEFLVLPLENLHPVSALVADEAAVFTEPLAAALEIQQQVHILPTDRVLVIGAGRLGQLIAQTLALTGCDLQVVARHRYQSEILQARGISTLAEEDLPEKKIDVVVEATGTTAGFGMARQAVRPRGVVVLKSTYKGELQVNFSSIVVDELTLVGSRCGPFPPALHLLEKKQVDPTPLITACYPLSEALPALQAAAQPGVLKVLIRPAVP